MKQRHSTGDDLSPLPRGTICFLTRVKDRPDWVGRVVEVVGGPRAEFGGGPGPFYDIRADWIEERFPGWKVIVIRAQLIPINHGNEDAAVSTADESASA